MNKAGNVFCLLAALLMFAASFPAAVTAKPSECEECHAGISPAMVTDFNRGKMAETLTCAACHGSKHNSQKTWTRRFCRRSPPAALPAEIVCISLMSKQRSKKEATD